MTRYTRRIAPHVQAELDAAAHHEARGEPVTAFTRLERAHVLAQRSTRLHVRVHLEMLRWALRQRLPGEAFGQAWRAFGAATKTALGWVPTGNTGGANVSGWRRMPIAPELQRVIDAAQS